MFARSLDLTGLLGRKSLLLLGPRQTGKSTLLQATWPDALVFDLLDHVTFRALATDLGYMRQLLRVHPGKPLVIVDEIQKLPELLDEVQRLLDADKTLRFVLTGSSARKLRRSSTNLLGGRLRRCDLYPITSVEGRTDTERLIDWTTLLRWGGLPSVLTSTEPKEELRDYVGLYLQEEIRAEGLTRSVTNFARFLETAALCNGEQVIFSSVASDAQVPARTVRDYFQILEDTLLGQLLPVFSRTRKRKAMVAPKFYFFDVGVANALLGRFDILPGTPEFGRALEHFVYAELTAALGYQFPDARLSYWRSLSQMEVDFVVELPDGTLVGIEVKATRSASPKDEKGLTALGEEHPSLRKILVCSEPRRRRTDRGVDVLPVAVFCQELWTGALFGT